MKKYLIALILMFCISSAALAQGNFVVKAGLNFNKLQDIKIDNPEQSWNSQTGFHAGIGGQYRIPLVGLSFQPEILYSRVRTDMMERVSEKSYNFRLDYLEVPLNIQWGINILFLRPYVFAAPYVRYALAKGNALEEVPWEDLNRFDYGLKPGCRTGDLEIANIGQIQLEFWTTGTREIASHRLEGLEAGRCQYEGV
jgi:hypothetical protein